MSKYGKEYSGKDGVYAPCRSCKGKANKDGFIPDCSYCNGCGEEWVHRDDPRAQPDKLKG